MTSRKCFTKWVKEAGRGHLSAFLAWGSFVAYAAAAVVRLGMDTETAFFGIGSREFMWLCAGLGVSLSLLEFCYLLQPRKLDFYYSLPVERGTVFWSRYVHGMVHFLVPMGLAMIACGLFESSVDPDFMPYSAGYTGRSILIFAAIFLIFYHIGILLLAACGNIIPVVLGYAAVLLYGDLLIANAFTGLAKNYFHTYYRIPLFERLDVMLAPLSLSGSLAGSGVYDKKAVFAYVPPASDIAAALAWAVFLLILFAAAQTRRKTEQVGKIFVLPLAERAAEVLLSFAAGVWCASLYIGLSGAADQKPGAAFAVSALIGVAAVCATHFLLEWGVGGLAGGKRGAGKRIWGFCRNFRRKRQLAAECAAVVLTGAVFFAGAPSFDGFAPETDEVEKIGVSIDGLDMEGYAYRQILAEASRYETDRQLETYLFSGEAKDAAGAWAAALDASAPEYTRAAVCYHMKDGREVYRTYPVSEEELQAYASVYDTQEYKKIAYHAPDSRYVTDARFLWSDGVTDTVLKLEDREKELLLDAWQSDIDGMEMEQLEETLPLGFIEIDSDMRLLSTQLAVYPFFSAACGFLEKHGMQIRKTLADYPASSVSVGIVPANGMGKQGVKYYQEPGEIAHWKARAVPEKLDLQPLLCPLDHSQEIKVEVEDETANSSVYVYCYPRMEAR